MKQFVNAGAEVNFPNHLGRTPLHKTIIHLENKHASRIVTHLLQSGAKPDPVDQYGAPPIYYCLFNLSKPYLDSDIAVTSITILSSLESTGRIGRLDLMCPAWTNTDWLIRPRHCWMGAFTPSPVTKWNSSTL